MTSQFKIETLYIVQRLSPNGDKGPGSRGPSENRCGDYYYYCYYNYNNNYYHYYYYYYKAGHFQGSKG